MSYVVDEVMECEKYVVTHEKAHTIASYAQRSKDSAHRIEGVCESLCERKDEEVANIGERFDDVFSTMSSDKRMELRTQILPRFLITRFEWIGVLCFVFRSRTRLR